MLEIQNFESRINRWKRKIQNLGINYFEDHTKVLLYHRVNTLTYDPLQLSVTPNNFYEQLKWLKKKYQIISLDELFDSLVQQKKIKHKTILITFDDGYADNFLEALPILQALQVPATFFITTSLLNNNEELWWDKLIRIILQNDQLPEKIILTKEVQYVASTANKKKLFLEIHDLLKFSNFSIRNDILNSLYTQIESNENENIQNRMMNFEELKKMSCSALVNIGAHTVNHLSLGIQQIQDQRSEIIESKNILEKLIQKPVNYFAYPYGTTRDFSDTTVKLLTEANFKLGFTNYHGFTTIRTNYYKIPRILIRNISPQKLDKILNKSF